MQKVFEWENLTINQDTYALLSAWPHTGHQDFGEEQF